MFSPGNGAVGDQHYDQRHQLLRSDGSEIQWDQRELHGDVGHHDSGNRAVGSDNRAAGVTTPGGTATTTAHFTMNLPPTITSFTPASGPVGTMVTITGTNLTAVQAVRFNGTVTGHGVISDTELRAQVPPGATTGPIEWDLVWWNSDDHE